MNGARYVLAGVARPRSPWFASVSQWANAAAIPAEFVKCIGVDELRARITSGRPFSAVLLDADLPGVDRDLLAVARDAGIAPLVIADGGTSARWLALGASAVLSPAFGRAELIDALAALAQLVSTADPTPTVDVPGRAAPLRFARVVAVTGPGGTGASTIAMAAAQAASGEDATQSPAQVVLADLCLRAEQGMLHDAQSVAPGLQELVDAHRSGRPDADDVRALCFGVHARGYDLLLGLRRRRLWTTLRPGAVAAAFEGLCSAYSTVVADVGPDVEGEEVSGSLDVEERNVLNRTALRAADLVLVVGHASLKGLHSLTGLIEDLREFGIPDGRIQPVMNAAPASARSRAAFARALVELVPSTARGGTFASLEGDQAGPLAPVFVPVRNIDACLRSAAPLPVAVVEPVAATLRRMPTAASAAAPSQGSWRRMTPGFLRGSAAGRGVG